MPPGRGARAQKPKIHTCLQGPQKVHCFLRGRVLLPLGGGRKARRPSTQHLAPARVLIASSHHWGSGCRSDPQNRCFPGPGRAKTKVKPMKLVHKNNVHLSIEELGARRYVWGQMRHPHPHDEGPRLACPGSSHRWLWGVWWCLFVAEGHTKGTPRPPPMMRGPLIMGVLRPGVPFRGPICSWPCWPAFNIDFCRGVWGAAAP